MDLDEPVREHSESMTVRHWRQWRPIVIIGAPPVFVTLLILLGCPWLKNVASSLLWTTLVCGTVWLALGRRRMSLAIVEFLALMSIWLPLYAFACKDFSILNRPQFGIWQGNSNGFLIVAGCLPSALGFAALRRFSRYCLFHWHDEAKLDTSRLLAVMSIVACSMAMWKALGAFENGLPKRYASYDQEFIPLRVGFGDFFTWMVAVLGAAIFVFLLALFVASPTFRFVMDGFNPEWPDKFRKMLVLQIAIVVFGLAMSAGFALLRPDDSGVQALAQTIMATGLISITLASLQVTQKQRLPEME
jgi:hypothetical protein